MLARLQRFVTLGLLGLAIGWFAWFAARGRFAWALGGALLIMLGYALFLGAELLLLAWQHGDDPTPRASARQLLRAWWGEARAAPQVFCWRQPFRARAETDHLGDSARGRTGVVLVHGFVCNRGFWNPWMRQLRQLGTPFVAVDLEPIFGSIDDYAPIIDRAVRRIADVTGRPPVIVAHSMGGLAVRGWWVTLGAGVLLERVVTIGSPHAGTWLARFGATLNGRQMRREGDWLAALAAAERNQRGKQPYRLFTCFYSHCDNIVFPPSTATLPGADNRHVPGSAHVEMAFQPDVFSEVCRWLEPAPSAPSAFARKVQ